MTKGDPIDLIIFLMFGWSILSIIMFFATIAGMIPMLLLISIFEAGAIAIAIGLICIMIISAVSEKQREASQ